MATESNNGADKIEVISRCIIPRSVDLLALEEVDEGVKINTTEIHKLNESGNKIKIAIPTVKSKSKSAVSSLKHYNNNKNDINKKRNEAAKKRRMNETDEERVERRKKRKEKDEARARKKAQMLMDTLENRGNSEMEFDRNKINGVYEIRKEVIVEKKCVYTHTFKPLDSPERYDEDNMVIMIEGRKKEGADIGGGFRFVKNSKKSKTIGNETDNSILERGESSHVEDLREENDGQDYEEIEDEEGSALDSQDHENETDLEGASEQ